MARVYLFKKPGALISLLYTVDQAVGNGRPNKSDDVALVQFFLRRVLEGWNDLPPKLPLLAIDGIFGDQTHRYIEYWQKGENLRPGGWGLAEDGIISPISARSGMISGSGHAKVFTMVTLNTNYADRWGNAWHRNIAIDSACPTQLLPNIFWS